VTPPVFDAPWLRSVRDLAHTWMGQQRPSYAPPTEAYADLLFAFGLARLGDSAAATDLVGQAHAALVGRDAVHQWLLEAFDYRLGSALAGQPHEGPLPEALHDRLVAMDRLSRYVIDRLRQHSRVLEPASPLEVYHCWCGGMQRLRTQLDELRAVADPAEVPGKVRALLDGLPRGLGGEHDRPKILGAALALAPRVGAAFARDLLELTLPTYDRLPAPSSAGGVGYAAGILQAALGAAAHFGLTAYIEPVAERYRQALLAPTGSDSVFAIALHGDAFVRSVHGHLPDATLGATVATFAERVQGAESLWARVSSPPLCRRWETAPQSRQLSTPLAPPCSVRRWSARTSAASPPTTSPPSRNCPRRGRGWSRCSATRTRYATPTRPGPTIASPSWT
jgi:hypothetical protein